MSDGIVDLVVADLYARKAQGTEQYGEPLRAHNGRDALLDAYEESLDLACYLRQELEERQHYQQLSSAVKEAIEALEHALAPVRVGDATRSMQDVIQHLRYALEAK